MFNDNCFVPKRSFRAEERFDIFYEKIKEYY